KATGPRPPSATPFKTPRETLKTAELPDRQLGISVRGGLMPARRSSSRVALFAALAVVGSPSFSRGQNAASLEIDRALFMVATKGPDGKWAVRETDRVPLRPRDA